MTVLNPDNKPTSLRVDALGRLRVTGTTGGGGGGGEGGAMATQVITESRALTEADNYTFIVLYDPTFSNPIILSVDDSLPADFYVVVIPGSADDGYQATGDALVNGGTGVVNFLAGDPGYQTELRRYPEIEGDGGNNFVVQNAYSTIDDAHVGFKISTDVPPLIATERSDFTIPQLDSKQNILGGFSLAAGGYLENYMRGQSCEPGSNATVNIDGRTNSGWWLLATQPGGDFHLTADAGTNLNGVDGGTETYTHGTENLVMVVRMGDAFPGPDYVAYVIG